MKLICSQSDLNSNLSLVSRIVPSRPEPLVLGNVLVIADDTTQKVSLTVFDGNLAIRTSFNAEVSEGGSITLPAKLFNDIVSKLPEMEINLDVNTSVEDSLSNATLGSEQNIVAILSSPSGKYQLSGIDASEFPELPTINTEEENASSELNIEEQNVCTVLLPVSALTEGLKCCLFAASTELSKQILTGIHFKTQKDDFVIDSLEFAATDSHRLAVVQTPLEVPETSEVEPTSAEESLAKTTNLVKDFAVTIPAKALRELERILVNSPADQTIKFSFDETQVIFELGDKRLSSLKLTGSYPAYNQLIPSNFSRQMIVDRKRLINSLELVAVLAQKNNVVKFSLDSEAQQLFLSVDARDVGNAKEALPAEIIGESIDIAFNIKYLMDGLKAMPASEIKMQLNEWNQPVIFTPVGGFKMTYLVMPVQLRN
ncbi:DNA polymerase III, beta subunit [Stanieria cyanosphaera PCC 7437]|uniref:DNA polymerase III, beta subunit n=1 Tax=Stanieria cyanosphaera (strain ATCC 29371 / PCC 7437) TaxID=111780 RepID=K9XW35_STAC7|nr:DNA polymerase III subunit beta [Stanieria cyanosphaera]AFZ36800.1 DNA polymerase III, beta subunit [Stanieria cyanosphaera PCC 7437]